MGVRRRSCSEQLLLGLARRCRKQLRRARRLVPGRRGGTIAAAGVSTLALSMSACCHLLHAARLC